MILFGGFISGPTSAGGLNRILSSEQNFENQKDTGKKGREGAEGERK